MAAADADKLMKQANKHCDPSFLSMRIKADWEQAQPLYERAAKMYKVESSCILRSLQWTGLLSLLNLLSYIGWKAV